MMRPSVRYPRPWLAEPMDADRPEGAWQVSCPSSVTEWAKTGLAVRDTGARTTVATYLTRGDAEDIAAGVNKLEAERRMNAEPCEPVVQRSTNEGAAMQPDQIARVAHEVNRAYCAALGDTSQPPWESAPEWQKSSAINGVKMHLANPNATPEDSHKAWLEEKRAAGWKYGPTKDPEKKEHPCFVPYGELPETQRAKDYLFRGVVHALKP